MLLVDVSEFCTKSHVAGDSSHSQDGRVVQRHERERVRRRSSAARVHSSRSSAASPRAESRFERQEADVRALPAHCHQARQV